MVGYCVNSYLVSGWPVIKRKILLHLSASYEFIIRGWNVSQSSFQRRSADLCETRDIFFCIFDQICKKLGKNPLFAALNAYGRTSAIFYNKWFHTFNDELR